MNASCITNGFASYTQQYESSVLDSIFITTLLSVAIGVFLAPVFLLIYQAFVRTLMMIKDPDASTFVFSPESRPQPLLARYGGDFTLDEMQKRQRYFTKVFSGCVLLFAFLLALSIYIIVGVEPDEVSIVLTGGNPVAEFLLPMLFALLMTLPLLNQVIPSGLYREVPAIIFILAGLSIGYAYLSSEQSNDLVVLLEETTLLLLFIFLFVGFAMQKVRNIAVVIILVTQLPVIMVLTASVSYEVVGSCSSLGSASEETQTLFIWFFVIPLILILLWFFWHISLWMFAKLVDAYDHKFFSDFQLQTVLWMLLITFVFSIAVSTESTVDDQLVSQVSLYPVLIFVFIIMLFWLFIRRVPHWDKPRKLLYLRVFATNKGSERLFDFISRYWRHIGPINMIGGPDFALVNLDIKEAYYVLFKRKQIHELFIDDSASLIDRLEHTSYLSSPDRQFSVNEFFCTDNMWKETVTYLVEEAEHVLLDLRGFTKERMGAAFELRLLGKMNLLQHTTIVVDHKTDWNAIKGALDSTENTLPEDQIISLDSGMKYKQVLLHLTGT